MKKVRIWAIKRKVLLAKHFHHVFLSLSVEQITTKSTFYLQLDGHQSFLYAQNCSRHISKQIHVV